MNVAARDLRANPKNWRRHNDVQRARFRAVAEMFGFADTLLAYYDAEGLLTLLNGHMRLSEAEPDFVFPVVVADLSQEDADFVLRTYDEVGRMADVDSQKLSELLREIRDDFEFGHEMNELLEKISERASPPAVDIPKAKKYEIKFRQWKLPLSRATADAFSVFLGQYAKGNGGSLAGLDERFAECFEAMRGF